MPTEIPKPWNDWETLVAAVIKEDAVAVPAYAELIGFMARGILRGKGLSVSDAEDLAVTCVTEIFLKLGKFRGGSFPHWARTLILHEFVDSFRRRSRSVLTDGDGALDHRTNETTPSRLAPPVRQAVADALSVLSDEDRLIVQLRFGGEPVEYKDIATVLKLKEGTVRVRYHRLRDHLDQVLRADPRMAPLIVKSDALVEKGEIQKPENQYAKHE